MDSVSIGLMMVETLDLRVKTKLSREVVSARLNNPKLEADLYPVGSWRDHPPTGEVIDLEPSASRARSIQGRGRRGRPQPG